MTKATNDKIRTTPTRPRDSTLARSRWRGAACLVVLLGVASAVGCTHTDAANVGAAVGHGLGTPVGVAAVAVEETFATAADIQDANRRHRRPQPLPRRVSRRAGSSSTPRKPAASRAGEDHYYRAEVVVRTRGPADIRSIEVGETEDVTEFWQ
jgi:hypothetical protein